MFNPINDWYLKIRWKIVGKENIDRSKCYVVVCNHQSALDAIGAGKVKSLQSIPRHRGGRVKYVFDPPTLTEDFRKINRGLFRKKGRRRRKIFGVPFFKNLTVFGEKNRKINGIQWLHDEKKPAAGEKFLGSFF